MRPLLLAFLITIPILVAGRAPAQTTDQSAGSACASDITAFRQEQAALFNEESALLENGATPEQLTAWRKQNAARFAAQQQRAKDMAEASAGQPMALLSTVRIPPDASPELRAFLTKQAELHNRLAQLHNQQLRSAAQQKSKPGAPALSSAESAQAVQEQFLEENAAEIQTQQQLAKVIARQNTQRPIPIPSAPRIPADASPELRALLTERHQLMVEQLTVQNQNRTGTPEAREAALKQWQTQNAARLQSVQQHARNLSQENQN